MPVGIISAVLCISNKKCFYAYCSLEAYERNQNFSSVPDQVEEMFHMDLPDAVSYRDVTGNTVLPPVTNESALQYLHPFGASLDVKCKNIYQAR